MGLKAGQGVGDGEADVVVQKSRRWLVCGDGYSTLAFGLPYFSGRDERASFEVKK